MRSIVYVLFCLGISCFAAGCQLPARRAVLSPVLPEVITVRCELTTTVLSDGQPLGAVTATAERSLQSPVRVRLSLRE